MFMAWSYWSALCFVSVISEVSSEERTRIVGLFKPLSYQDRAVQLAYNNRTDLVCLEPYKPFSANTSGVWREVCRILSGGLLALVTDQPLPSTVKDVIDAVKIPVVSTSIITTDENSTIVSVAPSEEQLANAVSTLIVYNSWTDVVLLTWQGSSIELFLPDSYSYEVAAVYHMDASDAVIKSRLSKIRQDDDISVIILHHYDLDVVLHIFELATEEGLHVYPYVWILIGNTAEMLMTRISNGNTFSYIPRLLGVYPVISDQPTKFAKLWKNYGSVKQLQGAAYLYDAFNIMLDAVESASLTIPNFTQIQQSCETPLQGWQFGRAFQEILIKEKSSNRRLTTGDVEYHYFSIAQNGFNKIATWTNAMNLTTANKVSSIRWCSQQDLINLDFCQGGDILRCNKKILPPKVLEPSPYEFDYSRYTFDVVTVEQEPFVDVTGVTEDGRVTYEGLCIDLMDRLSEMMGFSYTLRLVEDGNFGGQDENGNWMGLVGDLVNRRAEIALAPLTITLKRRGVIDFTRAYYNVGLQAIYNTDIQNDGDNFTISRLFSFLRPFDRYLWLLIIASVIVVSVGVTIIGRLSPYDWRHSPPDHFPLWESEFQMTLFNSFWQTLTAVLEQGAETAPRSTSGRVLMGGWWIVCVILGATFTANLTATFAVEDGTSDLPRSIDALISKIPPDIPFGAYNNTQTIEFFQHSPFPQYREAFEYMRTEGLLYDTADEGFAAAFNNNVALITDSAIVDFRVSRKGEFNPNCTLVSIGDGQFSAGGYALGLTKNSPFTDDFSLAILKLKREGVIERLEAEYFSYSRTCVSASIRMDTQKIDLPTYGGVFIILAIAVVVSPIVLLIEHTYKRRESIKTKMAKKFRGDDDHEVQSTLSDLQEDLRRTSIMLTKRFHTDDMEKASTLSDFHLSDFQEDRRTSTEL